MGRQKRNNDIPVGNYRPIDPESREQQMINLAVNEAERRLLDHTASSQIVVHYLNLATTQAQISLELARQDLELKRAKTEALESEKRTEQYYQQAIEAMRRYSGDG